MSQDIDDEPTPPRKVPAEQLALRTRPRPVMRMSRRAIAVATGTVGIAILGAAVWSLQGRDPRESGKAELYNVERIQKADGMADLPADYRAVPKLGAPLPGDLGRPMLRAQEEGRLDGPPPIGADPAARDHADAAQAGREAMLRERQAVQRADVFFGRAGGKADLADSGAPAVSLDTVASAGEGAAAPPEGSQAAKRAFASAEPDRRIYGNAELQTPRSPFQLMAGTVISAALVTGISSDLPGQTIATVTANVFDSVTGRHLLVPQGSRLIGRYDSAVGFGQSRLLLVWERLIMPDGSSLVLDSLPGTDLAGQTGLKDRVDNHIDRLVGGALLSTLLGVGAELAAPDRSGRDGRLIVATRDSAQEIVSETGQQITRRNLDVQPTLTVRAGFPLRILVQRDLVLRPYTQR